MKQRLVVDPPARLRAERRRCHHLDVEAHVAGERGLGAEHVERVFTRLVVCLRRDMAEAWHAVELAGDAVVLDQPLDLIDGGQASVPHRLRVIVTQRRRRAT